MIARVLGGRTADSESPSSEAQGKLNKSNPLEVRFAGKLDTDTPVTLIVAAVNWFEFSGVG